MTNSTAPDMAVRGGLVLDGSGGEPFPADLLTREGRIIAIDSDSGVGKKAFTIDAGDHMVAVRNETDRVAEAVGEAIEIGRRTSASVQISHLEAAGRGNHGRLPELLALFGRASEVGIDVTGDAYPYEWGSTVMHALLPPWATEGGIDATISRLQRGESRARRRRDFDKLPSVDWQNFIEGGSWDDVAIASARRNPDMEGSTVGELARARREHPVDFVVDLLIIEQAAVRITVEMADEDDVGACIASSRIMIGSDGIPLPGIPRPRWAGSFARVLSRPGRDRFGLSLPEAVRKMTSLPAGRFDLGARDVIEIGAAADIVVFDEGSDPGSGHLFRSVGRSGRCRARDRQRSSRRGGRKAHRCGRGADVVGKTADSHQGGRVTLEAINDVAGMCPPPEPYSYAVRAGDTLYLSGQVALDETGEVVGSTVVEQSVQVWNNISLVLSACGSSVKDVVKVTYYMQDIRELSEEMEVRKQVFTGRAFPAVTAMQAAALGLPGLKMEVDVVAVISGG